MTEGKKPAPGRSRILQVKRIRLIFPGEPVYKYITDTLNVRKGPSVDTEKLATVSKGDRVQSFDVEVNISE